MKHILAATPMFAKFDKTPIRQLTEAGYEITVLQAGSVSRQTVMENIRPDTVAIISGLESLDGEIMDAAPALKAIVKHGIGVDNIDLNAAKERRIGVYNAPGSNSDAVADLAVGLMFALARNIVPAANTVSAEKWSKEIGTGVWGKTLGILGFGNVGRLTALRGKGMNMRVLAYDPYFNEAFASEHGIERADIETILREADFVSLHMPLMDSTRNMIGKTELSSMKPSAFLINTARGGVVDEEALYEALSERRIAGAAFDAFAEEPPEGNRLLTLKNFLGTPHMGAYTDDALIKTSAMVTDTLLRVLRGENVRNRVI